VRRGMLSALRGAVKQAPKPHIDPALYEELLAHWDASLALAAQSTDALDRFFPADVFAESQWDATNTYRSDTAEDEHALAALLREWLITEPSVVNRWSQDQALAFAKHVLSPYRETFANDIAHEGGALYQAFTIKGINEIRAFAGVALPILQDLLEEQRAGFGEIMQSLRELRDLSKGSEDELKTLGEELQGELARERQQFFDHLIEYHTKLFAGRDLLLDQVNTFVRTARSGYVYIEVPSGFGKTSFLARLVQRNPSFAYHFISQAYKTSDAATDPTQLESLLLNLNQQLSLTADDKLEGTARARFHQALPRPLEAETCVVVIDGIDEVDKYPHYLKSLLPASLPTGIHVILSGRTMGDHDYLREVGLFRTDIALLLQLPGLDIEAISSLLDLAGQNSAEVSQDNTFLRQLHEISGGDPFYLRFLIEDVNAGRITRDNLTSTPSGLTGYLDVQLSLLDNTAHSSQQRDVLGFILAAYGPVSRWDLIALVPGLDGFKFDNVLRDIHKFVIATHDSYTLCHKRVKDYFEAKVHVKAPLDRTNGGAADS
jgi:hypothetical protein